MTNPPSPLVPPEVDLRGLEWMPLYGNRLFGSTFDVHVDDATFRAGMQAWWSAWNQVPAASLPNDDIALCRLAGLGKDMRTWKKIKAKALHGFVLCSDDRLYHRAMATWAMDAWRKRLGDRERKAKWRAEKERRDREEEERKRAAQGHPGNGSGDWDGDVPETGTGPFPEADNGRDNTVPGTTDRRGEDRTGQESKYSEANASGASGPPDVMAVVFGAGLAWLKRTSGKPDAQCRSLLGKWRKEFGSDEVLIAALGRAQRECTFEPVGWMTKAIQTHKAHRSPPKTQGWN